jgi:hypothetical protein
MATQASRQEVVRVLRTSGFADVADEVIERLPDPVDLDDLADFLAPYGVTKDQVISRMGGSP